MIRMLIVVLALLYPVRAAAETAYTVITEVNGENLGVITDIEVDSTDALWVAADCGLLRLKYSVWTKERQDGYGQIVIAYDGSLWYGTGENKVLRFDGTVWTELPTPDNYWDYGIGPDGAVWIAGMALSDPKVYRYDGNTWTSYSTADGLADHCVGKLIVSPSGEVWARYESAYPPKMDGEVYTLGIYHYKNGTWRVYNEENGFVDDSVMDFAVLSDSSIAVSYGNPNSFVSKIGVTKWDGSEWHSIVTGHFGNLTIDRNDNLWMATMGDIHRYDGTTVKEVYRTLSGMPSLYTRVAVTEDGRLYTACLVNRVSGLLVLDTAVVVDEPTPVRGSFPAIAAYPNPFNPTTTISYAIPASGRVTLRVYSVSGQKVATLVDELQEAGSHSVVFDGKGLSSGVYLYRLETAGAMKTGRMLIVK